MAPLPPRPRPASRCPWFAARRLCERVEVRTHRGQAHHPYSTPLQGRSEIGCVERIPIEQKVAFPHQEAVLGIEQVPGDLIHPDPVRTAREPGDLHLAARDVDQEQDMVSDKSDPRDGLDGEEVSSRNRPQVQLDERGPRHAPSSERAGSMPSSLKRRAMLARPIAYTTLLSAPRSRVYPHRGFSVAILTSSRAISAGFRGRPGPRFLLRSFSASCSRCSVTRPIRITERYARLAPGRSAGYMHLLSPASTSSGPGPLPGPAIAPTSPN